jgi:hypothetical protein
MRSLIENLEEARGRQLTRDFKLTNGDVIPKGTPVEIEWQGEKASDGHRACFMRVNYTGESGRNYFDEPIKVAIRRLHMFLNGFKPPSYSRLEKMVNDMISTTPTGKRVEVDGYGPDGSPAWTLILGIA